jgi:hypothetical protein
MHELLSAAMVFALDSTGKAGVYTAKTEMAAPGGEKGMNVFLGFVVLFLTGLRKAK